MRKNIYFLFTIINKNVFFIGLYLFFRFAEIVKFSNKPNFYSATQRTEKPKLR